MGSFWHFHHYLWFRPHLTTRALMSWKKRHKQSKCQWQGKAFWEIENVATHCLPREHNRLPWIHFQKHVCRDFSWILFTMQMWRISTLFCFIFLPLFCVLSPPKCIISYFSGWFNPSLMEKLWFDNSKLAGWFTKGRDILPSFWHSSPSHYWHYIRKRSHLLGSILWFMIPTKKRNGDQW